MGCSLSRPASRGEPLGQLTEPGQQLPSPWSGGKSFVVPCGVHTTMLHLKRQFWSLGPHLTVVGVRRGQARPLFNVSGEVTPVRRTSSARKLRRATGRRQIFDAATGRPIFYFKEKPILGLPSTLAPDRTVVCDGETKQDLFKVSSNLTHSRTKVEGLADGEGRLLQIEGSLSMARASGMLYCGTAGSTGIPIARLHSADAPGVQEVSRRVRAHCATDGLEEDDYFVEVAPGVDAALVLATILAYEEHEAPYDEAMSEESQGYDPQFQGFNVVAAAFPES